MVSKQKEIEASVLLSDAVGYHQKGELVKAKALYKKNIKISPVAPQTHHLLGLLYQQQNNSKQSIKHHQLAVLQNGAEIQYVKHLADSYRSNGQLSKFEELMLDSVKNGIADIDIYEKLADYYLSTRDYRQSIAYFMLIKEKQKNNWRAHLGIGNCYFEQGNNQLALAEYQSVLKLVENQVDALNNIATIYMTDGNNEEALTIFRQIINHYPNHLLAHLNFASLNYDIGNYQISYQFCQKALDIDSTHVNSQVLIAKCLSQLSKPSEAFAIMNTVINEGNKTSYIYNTLGTFYDKIQDSLHAAEYYQLAINIDGNNTAAHYNLATSALHVKNYSSAIASFRLVLSIDSNFHQAKAPLMHTYRQCCMWDEAAEMAIQVRKLLNEKTAVNLSPFSLITLEDSTSDEQLLVAKHWYQYHIGKNEFCNLHDENKSELLCKQQNKTKSFDNLAANAQTKNRIKVAYLSADFHDHATTQLLVRMIELHNKSEFEIFGYSYGVDDKSKLRKRLISAFEHFIEMKDKSLSDMVDEIKKDQIDILIDLKGFTKHNRSEILSYRLAPIQIGFLGYPATMGKKLVDYVIADKYVTPMDSKQFEEEVLYLPNCYQPNDSNRDVLSKPSRQSLGLPEKSVVFGAFHQNYKINRKMLVCWCHILESVNNSVLWLLVPNEIAKQNILKVLDENGIAMERIIFAPQCSPRGHMARIQLVDIMLDSYPVNGHTSTSDALWAGVPVVSRSGKTFISRVAGSILHTMNLNELIANDLENYQKIAINLANDSNYLQIIKDKIRKNKVDSPLFDSHLYTTNFETMLRGISSTNKFK